MFYHIYTTTVTSKFGTFPCPEFHLPGPDPDERKTPIQGSSEIRSQPFHATWKEGKGREGKGREGKGREGKGREGKGREGKGREGKGREGKGREGKGREGKGREGKEGSSISLSHADLLKRIRLQQSPRLSPRG